MKRVWKRWGALLLAVVMTLSLLPTAALAEGETEGDALTNLALNKTTYASGEEDSTLVRARAVDGDSSTHWGGTKMKNGAANTETATNAFSWFVVDLLSQGNSDRAVNSISSVTMSFNALVWPTECCVQVATDNVSRALAAYEMPAENGNTFTKYFGDYTGDLAYTSDKWKTIATFSKESSNQGQAANNPGIVTMSTDYTESVDSTARADGEGLFKVAPASTNFAAIPKGVRYVRVCFTGINTNAGGTCIGMKELTVMGTTQPTVTQYLRHTGPIEEGIYVIYDNGRNLHNQTASPKRTDQCGTPAPNGDTIGVGDGNHLWRIAGNDTDGYTIQGDKSGAENYLTTSETNSTQLALDSDSAAAVKLSIVEAPGGGYKLSYVDNDGTTKYFGLRSGQNGWEFSETLGTVQLFKKTAVPVTIASATDSSRDVGVTNGTYSNTNNSVIHAWASSQHGSGSDGPATWAVDNDTDSIWHSCYDSGTGTENTDAETTNKVGWHQDGLSASVENRWIELDIRENNGAPQWLSGLRYKGRSNSNGGTVTSCEIRVWDETAGAWAKVTSDTAWTMEGANHGEWKYKEFDDPVLTNKVRLYGVTTDCANNQYMVASDMRLVKALTQTAPATQEVTITVKDAAGNPIEGATVNSDTTVENGQVTRTLMDGMTYIFTVSKEGFKTRTVKVKVDGADTAPEVTLCVPLNLVATDATYDYPLTDKMVSAVSQHDNDGTNHDGHANWAIDYESHWWHQDYNQSQDVWFAFSLPAEVSVAGIRYQQRDGGNTGAFGGYEIQTSADGITWTTLKDETGTWDEDHDVHLHELEVYQTARYFRAHRTNGNASNRTAKLFQLVLAPEARTTVTGTVTKDGQPMSGVTVQVYQGDTATYKTATTGSDGRYSIVLPKDGTADSWKLVVDASGCKHAEYTVTTNAATDTHDFALENRELHLTGTAPEGVTVQLMQGAGRTPVAGIEAQTETNFDFDVSTLAAGTYYVRAWKDGYVPAWKEVTWTAATESPVTVTVADSDLVAVAAGNAGRFTFDSGIEGFKVLNEEDATAPALSNVDGALQIAFTDSSRTQMWYNAVGHADSQLQNGTIEFDITPKTGSTNNYNRLGLTLRQDNNNYLYVGHGDGAGTYFAQNSTRSNSNDVSNQYHSESSKVQLVKDLKRHVKVTLNNGTVTMWVDGIQVLTWGSAYNPGVGLVALTSEANCTILIDNLNITRADTESAVTLTTSAEGESLTAVITTPYDQTGVALTSGDNAFAGDTIKITGSNTNGVLYQVTVNGSADSVTRTETEGGGYTFTFTMPAAPATVEGTFAPNVPDFTVNGKSEDSEISAGTYVGSTFTGNTLTIDGTMASDTDAEIHWYKKTGDGAWTEITGETGSSYTIKQGDYNSETPTQLKVTVSGNDVHHAGTKDSCVFTVTAPVYAVTGVTLSATSLELWSNGSGTTTPKTATLTATVVPADAGNKAVTWTSDNREVATVDQNGLVTAVAAGTANITVTTTDGEKTATCAVTVKTRVAGITVKNGETVVTESAPAKVYLNDDDDEAPRSITLIGTVDPTTASDTGLVWTRTGGATGKINIQPAGGSDTNPDSATSSGSGVTISAVGIDSKNVGEVIVKVAAHDGKGAETTFKVQVWRKLAHDVTIGGTPKYGETLEVNTDSLDMTDDGKAALTYQWKRTKNGTTENIGTAAVGAAGKTYTLTEADIGATISVVVTAGANTFYEGSKTASTATVAKADGPSAPAGLGTTACTTDGNNDGTITGLTAGSTYEVCKQDNDDSWDWDNAETKTADENGAITGLTPGNYQVRIPGTTTTKPGAASTTLNILENGANAKNITIDSGIQNGAVSTNRSAVDPEVTVTVTVTPDAGYQLKADTLKVTQKSNSAEVSVTDAGLDTDGTLKFTFTMPDDDVTITAQFKPIQITITLALTNITAKCDADGEHTGNDTHKVDYGAVTEIELEPDEGFELPQSITVTYTDPEDTATAPNTRWTYSKGEGKIAFTYGAQKDITITAKATQITYTVQLSATGGHLDLSNDEATVNHGADFTGTLSVSDTAYELPSEITVTMGDATLTAGTGYTYTQSTGAISIPNVTGDVTITAEAKAKTTEVAGVTIGITHSDSTGMGSGNQDVPHVGDTLTATAAPAGATVTYQWFVGESETAAGTSQTFVVPDTEGIVGQTIKVVVTGTGTYSGTANATTAAVGEKTWRVTGVSLNKTATSLVFQAEETLTATVAPGTATNKNVTWSSSNPNVATVDASGKVTAVGVGTATITVTTEDGAQTATCQVTVTAKALPQLQITTPQVDKTASVSFAGGVSTDVATYQWYTGESVDAENNDAWNRVSGVSGASWLVTGVPYGRYIRVIAYAKDGGNYTGSSTVVSAAILSNETEVETYEIAVNKTGEGTVTVKVNDTEATEAAENDTVAIEVTGLVAGATVEATSETEGVTLIKGTGNTWTFTMPAKAVEITVTITEPVVEKYAITVSDAANGTVTAKVNDTEATEAAEGATVTLTDTPDEGYKLDTLTVTRASGTPVMVGQEMTHGSEEIIWKFTMPAEAVTVTATFVVDTAALEETIAAAENAKENVEVAEKAEDVPNNKEFVTSKEVIDALDAAIAAAKEALEAENKNAESVAAAVEALNAAVETFEAACQPGTKATSNPPVIVLPSKDPEVTEDEDGTKTTVETQPDGTVIETTEKPDGTVEVVETKKDGTVTETTTQPDGTKEVVETKPDGTVTETTERPDGTVTEVVTEPDGTVTETKTDADGAKVEKVTDPEEGVTITATDATGETVAEMKIPTVMPELETRFEDVPVDHWADKAIHQLAAIEVVEGVGDNKYDMAAPMNRGALATVLHRLSNKPAGSEVSFEDVLDGKYYTEGVAWAAKVGVVKGFSDDEFKPEETITREQLALMLMRYAKLLGMDTSADAVEVAKFADGKNTHAWALDGIAWCVKAEIIRGRTDGTLAPTDNVTRAEVAVMIDRFIALMK